MRVFVHGCAATPLTLLEAMTAFGKEARLHNVEIFHIHTEGPAVYTEPDCEGTCQDIGLVTIHLSALL